MERMVLGLHILSHTLYLMGDKPLASLATATAGVMIVFLVIIVLKMLAGSQANSNGDLACICYTRPKKWGCQISPGEPV